LQAKVLQQTTSSSLHGSQQTEQSVGIIRTPPGSSATANGRSIVVCYQLISQACQAFLHPHAQKTTPKQRFLRINQPDQQLPLMMLHICAQLTRHVRTPSGHIQVITYLECTCHPNSDAKLNVV
jgi:hypothetical protein